MQYSFTVLAFATTVFAASQISDGQVQAPTAVVSQIHDGQVQAPTGAVSQIHDGQVQAPTGVVSQINDGQVQVPTAVSTVKGVTQITDGQIQAPTAVSTVQGATQITDGQIQVASATGGAAPPPANGTFATSKPSATAFTGAAAIMSWSKEIVVAAVGVAAGFAML